MHLGRSTRLIAGVLFLLLIGWTVRRWRSRTHEEEFHEEAVHALDGDAAPEIDLPRE